MRLHGRSGVPRSKVFVQELPRCLRLRRWKGVQTELKRDGEFPETSKWTESRSESLLFLPLALGDVIKLLFIKHS